MAGVALHRRRWAPRAHGATIDGSHPAAVGLTSLWTARTRVLRLTTGQVVTVAGTAPAFDVGPYGVGFTTPTSSDHTIPDPFSTSIGSMFAILKVPTPAGGSGFGIGTKTGTGSARWGAHFPFGDGTVYFDIGTSAERVSYAGHTWGGWDVWGLTNGPLNGQRIWLNGLSVASAAERTSKSGTDSAGFGPCGVFAGTTNLVGSMAFIATWSRELTPNEIAALYADPFDMLKG